MEARRLEKGPLWVGTGMRNCEMRVALPSEYLYILLQLDDAFAAVVSKALEMVAQSRRKCPAKVKAPHSLWVPDAAVG